MTTKQRLDAFEAGLVRLSLLMADGQGKSEQAWKLRDQLATIELEMPDNDRLVIHGLSSDLYSIEDEEIYDDLIEGLEAPRALAQAMQRQYVAQNWNELITLLRQRAEFLPPEIRAYLRGRAYEEIGYNAAAWVFFQDAAHRDSDDDRFSYQYFALYNLQKWDREMAIDQARKFVEDSNSHPVLKILAVNVLLQESSQQVEQSRPDTLERNVPDIRVWANQLIWALGGARVLVAVPNEILASGYAALALILELFRDYQNAADMMRLVNKYMPGEPEVQRRIDRFDKLTNTGQSIYSAIILNPEALLIGIAGNIDESPYAIVDRKVERVLASVK